MAMTLCVSLGMNCEVGPPPIVIPIQKSSNPIQQNPLDISKLPVKSRPYATLIKRISKNPSREMALTEQESGWNTNARSPYAKGLRQFTDRTGRWLARTHCRSLGRYKPYDPNWSLRCGVIYVELLQKNNRYGDYCNNRKIAEQEYNGGTWVIWELRTAKTHNLKKAQQACYGTLYNGKQRAEWACEENYNYSKHISRRQIKYTSIGGQLCR